MNKFNQDTLQSNSITSKHIRRDLVSQNGCHLTLLFSHTPTPQLQKDVAIMLLAAFEKRKYPKHQPENELELKDPFIV